MMQRDLSNIVFQESLIPQHHLIGQCLIRLGNEDSDLVMLNHLLSDGPYVESVEAACARNQCLRWGHIEYRFLLHLTSNKDLMTLLERR